PPLREPVSHVCRGPKSQGQVKSPDDSALIHPALACCRFGGFLPVCLEVRKRSKRSLRWLRGEAQRFLSAHTFIYGQGRRQIVHQLPAAHEPLLLDAVMGPPQVAGFGKRWLSLTVMV